MWELPETKYPVRPIVRGCLYKEGYVSPAEFECFIEPDPCPQTRGSCLCTAIVRITEG